MQTIGTTTYHTKSIASKSRPRLAPTIFPVRPLYLPSVLTHHHDIAVRYILQRHRCELRSKSMRNGVEVGANAKFVAVISWTKGSSTPSGRLVMAQVRMTSP